MSEGDSTGASRGSVTPSVLVDLDGTKLLTDPVLRPRVLHLRRAWAADSHSLRGIDAVLVSHVHSSTTSISRRSSGSVERCP